MSVLVLDGVHAGLLTGASIELGPGLNVVLGAPRDGTETLARLFSGCERPRRGRVGVGGRDPWRTPETRARVGTLFASEPAPGAASIEAHVRRALALRGDRADARALLGEHGLASVASHRPERTPPEILRHVALMLALSLRHPLALVLHEPFSVGPYADRERTRRALEAHARDGVSVVTVTASARDASELGGQTVLLDGGRFVRRPGVPLATELAPGQSLVLRVKTPSARQLAASLSTESSISGLEFDEGAAPGELTVRSLDGNRAALALMALARRDDLAIEAIEPVLPGLDLARAASQGLWRAAYDAAYRAAQERAKAQQAAVIARTAAIAAPVEPSDGAPS